MAYGDLQHHRAYGCISLQCHCPASGHSNTCKYQTMGCMIEYCKWNGTRGSYGDHVREVHEEGHLFVGRNESVSNCIQVDGVHTMNLDRLSIGADHRCAISTRAIIYADDDVLVVLACKKVAGNFQHIMPLVIYSPPSMELVIDMCATVGCTFRKFNMEHTYVGDLAKFTRATRNYNGLPDAYNGVYVPENTLFELRPHHVPGVIDSFQVSFNLYLQPPAHAGLPEESLVSD